MYPNTPKINSCPCCGSSSGPVLLRDMDVEPGRTPTFESPVHWLVMCDFTKGGCGLRGGYRDTPFKAVEVWNKRKENKVEQEHEVKFFKALDKLGVEWRDWADKFQKMFLKTCETTDARLLNIENRIFKQKGQSERVLSQQQEQQVEHFKFYRMGFLFEIQSDKATRVTQGRIIRIPECYSHLHDELLRKGADTECQTTDNFNAKHGAQIVLMKLIAHVKSTVMNHAHRDIRREHNRLQDLHWEVRGANPKFYPRVARARKKLVSMEV